MKLTLHIGLGKTGTTSLQRFMDAETDVLASAGVTYAGLGLAKLDTGFSFQNMGHVNDPANLAKGVEALATAAKRPDALPHIFWSHESFGMGFGKTEIAPVLREFLDATEAFDEVEIIMVLRRQDDWIESAYRQWGLKHKTYNGTAIQTPVEYADRVAPLLDYDALYRSWSDAFGPEAVQVLSYDDVKAAGGIVSVICDQLAIPYDPRFDAEDAQNRSYGVSQSAFFALHNRGHERPLLARVFAPVLDDYDLPELAAPDVAFFDTEVRQRLLDTYAPSNAALANRLGRERLFEDRPVKTCRRYTIDEAQEHAMTYFAMIAQAQRTEIAAQKHETARLLARIERQNERLTRLEARAQRNLFGLARRAFRRVIGR